MNLTQTQVSSTNCLIGLIIVHPEGVDVRRPVEGDLFYMGKIHGHYAYRLQPREGAGRWYIITDDAEPIEGCSVVRKVGLQPDREVTMIVCGEFAAYTEYGYKRRSSNVVAWMRGEEVNLLPAVLAAMGILQVNETPVDVEPAPISGGLVEALKKAGIV